MHPFCHASGRRSLYCEGDIGELTECRCGVNFIYSGECFDRDSTTDDTFYMQSEVGRISSQYSQMGWVGGSGSSSPNHG